MSLFKRKNDTPPAPHAPPVSALTPVPPGGRDPMSEIFSLDVESVRALAEAMAAEIDLREANLAQAALAEAPTPPPAAAAPVALFYRVVLRNLGDKKIHVIKIVRAATGLALKETKDLVESMHPVLKRQMDKEAAQAMAAELNALGARAVAEADEDPSAGAAGRATPGMVLGLNLERARLADWCRDAGAPPVATSSFDAPAADFDPHAQRRAALAIALLEHPDVKRSARRVLERPPGGAAGLWAALVNLVKSTASLTLPLVRESPLRAEEFARHFIAAVGASVRGEADADSRQKLERLDYSRVLSEAERAKTAAQERMEYLRRLREAARPPSRGKW